MRKGGEMTILEWARFYKSKGFSVIPLKYKNKIPVIEWKEYQTRIATDEELIQRASNITDVMDIGDSRPGRGNKRFDRVADAGAEYDQLSAKQLNAKLKKLENEMYQHARDLEFEDAARMRDQIAEIKEQYFQT